MGCFRRVLAVVLVVVAFLVICPARVAAQMPGLGRINGIVTDESGAAVGEVQIQTKTAKGGVIETKTNGKGDWVVAGLGKGVWDVEFAKDGFKPVRAKVTIETELRRTEPIKITLKKG